MLHVKFGFDWPSGFREEDLWKWWTTDDGRTDAGSWPSYKLTLWAWRLRWANNNATLLIMTTSYSTRHVTDMYITLVYRNNALEEANWGIHLIFSDLFSWNIVENIYEISKQTNDRPETPKSAHRPLKDIRQKLLKLFGKDVKMLTEWRNHGITDRLKTVYPTKTLFAGGIKNAVNLSKIIFFSIIILSAKK